ncbi:MAG: UMP kinase [Candidatus Liptonbacteria bacterium]
MRYRLGKEIVVGLGGSIVCPAGVNTAFLRKFHRFVSRITASGHKVVVVIGGGGVAREYQKAAGALIRVTNEDKDWLGIHATRLNAHLIRTVFRDTADPVVWDNEKKVGRLKYKVTVASGWHPGWSTDYVAFAIAKKLNIKEVIVAGKPDFVYGGDPAKDPQAEKFERMSWPEYAKLIPKTWNPGMHATVDPVAARLGARQGIRAIVLDGRNLKNFRALLRGGSFRGTIIG